MKVFFASNFGKFSGALTVEISFLGRTEIKFEVQTKREWVTTVNIVRLMQNTRLSRQKYQTQKSVLFNLNNSLGFYSNCSDTTPQSASTELLSCSVIVRGERPAFRLKTFRSSLALRSSTPSPTDQWGCPP